MTRSVPYRGAIVTLLLIVLLVSPPGELFDRDSTFVDSRADFRTRFAQNVELGDGLRDDVDKLLPYEFGAWRGVSDRSWEAQMREALAFDQLVVREYVHPDLFLPVQVMVLTARHAQAFHNPEVCFRNVGGDIETLETVSYTLPATIGTVEVPVGRMFIEYEARGGRDAPLPRMVYNLYVVESHTAAPDRTSWIRLTFFGAVENATSSYDPVLNELLEHVTPYLFQGVGTARTTFEWLVLVAGWPAAIIAGVASVVPLGFEAGSLWRGRR